MSSMLVPRPLVASLKELWRPIKNLKVDFEGHYEVSNLGRIRSLDKCVKGSNKSFRFIKGKILNPATDKKGYKRVMLTNSTQVKFYYLVHTIVAFNWIETISGEYGCKSNCFSIDHIDRNPSNNNPHNLRWMSSNEHPKQGNDTRKPLKGEDSHQSILKESDIIEIRNSDLTYKELSIKYGVKRTVLQAIINGTKWKHVPYPNKNKQIEKRRKGTAKFSNEDIYKILDDNRSQQLIAKDYGVSQMVISRVKRFPEKYLK